MSLVENLINQISLENLGGITKPLGFDLADDTFEKLLQKAGMNQGNENNQVSDIGKFGVPAGLNIEPLDAPQEITKVEPVNTEEVQIKDIDMSDYFTNILKTQSADNKGIFDLAMRHAANTYNAFAGKFVANLNDFVKDIKSAV